MNFINSVYRNRHTDMLASSYQNTKQAYKYPTIHHPVYRKGIPIYQLHHSIKRKRHTNTITFTNPGYRNRHTDTSASSIHNTKQTYKCPNALITSIPQIHTDISASSYHKKEQAYDYHDLHQASIP